MAAAEEVDVTVGIAPGASADGRTLRVEDVGVGSHTTLV